MEQRTAAIKFGGWSEFGVGSAPERRMRTLISGQCLVPADKRSLLAMRKAATWLIAAGVIICLNVSARAEDPDAGKAEYLSSCATCHGSDGKGKGPHSSKLKDKTGRFDPLRQEEQGRVSIECSL